MSEQNIRFRYLFLKSRKHAPPKRILYAFPKLILFLLIASTFDPKIPSKAHYDLEVEIKQHCEPLTVVGRYQPAPWPCQVSMPGVLHIGQKKRDFL